VGKGASAPCLPRGCGRAGVPAEKAASSDVVIASAAKQSSSPRKGRMDCFVASAPRNDVVGSRFSFQTSDTHPPSRDMVCPSFAGTVCPPRKEGAGNAGCALHPRSRVQDCAKNAHTSIQVQRKHSGIPRAMVLRLMPCSPRRRIRLVTVAAGLMARRSGWIASATGSLTPATGAGTTRFCRTLQRRSSCTLVDRSRETRPAITLRADAAASTASHPNDRDDHDTPLLPGWDRAS
jgi:hypothetical protein